MTILVHSKTVLTSCELFYYITAATTARSAANFVTDDNQEPHLLQTTKSLFSYLLYVIFCIGSDKEFRLLFFV